MPEQETPSDAMPQMDIMKLLDPLPERFAVHAAGSQPRMFVDEAEARKAHEETPDSQLIEIVGYRFKAPDLKFILKAKDATNRWVLAQHLISALGHLSGQIMTSVRGDAPIIQVARPNAPLPPGAKPALRIVKGGRG